MNTCLLCERSLKNARALIKHVNIAHQISSQSYYDTFVKVSSEGRCRICDANTTFRGIGKGYLTYCSISCRDKCDEHRHKKSLAKSGIKQSYEHIRKRVSSTDQKMKEETRTNTFLERYGVTSPSQLEHIRARISKAHKGTKKPRTASHQNNIMLSKAANGTLVHSEASKKKISDAVRKSEKWQTAKELGLFVAVKNNSKTLGGKFKNIHFRSSYELSFLLEMHLANIEVVSAENKTYRIQYEYDGKKSYYYPDFFVPSKNCLVEIKPKAMLNYNSNPIKHAAAKQYCETMNYVFKIYTEDDLKDIKKIINCIDEKSLQHLEIFKNEHICFG